MPGRQMQHAQALARNPGAFEHVIAEAKEPGDIPTRQRSFLFPFLSREMFQIIGSLH